MRPLKLTVRGPWVRESFFAPLSYSRCLGRSSARSPSFYGSCAPRQLSRTLQLLRISRSLLWELPPGRILWVSYLLRLRVSLGDTSRRLSATPAHLLTYLEAPQALASASFAALRLDCSSIPVTVAPHAGRHNSCGSLRHVAHWQEWFYASYIRAHAGLRTAL